MNIEERVLAYLKDELSEADRAAFDDELTESRVLRAEVVRLRGVLESLAASSAHRVTERVNNIIRDAIAQNASDIHLTPENGYTRLRFRVDGVLHEAERLPQELHQALVDDWKAMSGTDLHERRVPQDGRFPVVAQNKNFDLRVNIAPTLRGERVTARILARDADAYTVKLDALGLSEEQKEQLKAIIEKPSGLLLVTGEAGAGKTTLAYALLHHLVSLRGATANIISAEDPVELEIEGVSQCGANKSVGLSLADVAHGLGQRADPDIVYISNLRDPEVAQIAADLAATGRLVIGVLAARGAREAIASFTGSANAAESAARRMVLLGVATTRLTRRGAGEWRPYEPDPPALAALGLTPADGPFQRPERYQGRIGLYEVREADEIGDGLPEPRTGDYRAAARAAVRAGVTTVEEAVRALAF